MRADLVLQKTQHLCCGGLEILEVSCLALAPQDHNSNIVGAAREDVVGDSPDVDSILNYVPEIRRCAQSSAT